MWFIEEKCKGNVYITKYRQSNSPILTKDQATNQTVKTVILTLSPSH